MEQEAEKMAEVIERHLKGYSCTPQVMKKALKIALKRMEDQND